MHLIGFGLVVFIASIALIGSCGGQEDDIVEVLLVDGPGGYLPDIDEDIGNEMDFAQAPSLDEEYYTDQVVMHRHWLDFFSHWENYFRLIMG